MWWGIWLVGGAASGWLPALVTVASPLAMTYFLRNVTGARLLEQTMSTGPAGTPTPPGCPSSSPAHPAAPSR